MAQLVDSSVFIGLERSGRAPSTFAALSPTEPMAIASVTASELLTGIYRANTVDRRTRRENFVEAVLAAIPVLPFDLHVARVHARLWAQLAAVGQLIGDYDLIIAATALTHGYDLVTDNLRHFERVSGLTVRRPTWPQ